MQEKTKSGFSASARTSDRHLRMKDSPIETVRFALSARSLRWWARAPVSVKSVVGHSQGHAAHSMPSYTTNKSQ
eukprot:3396547-Pyramimonas_sp.AAC.1